MQFWTVNSDPRAGRRVNRGNGALFIHVSMILRLSFMFRRSDGYSWWAEDMGLPGELWSLVVGKIM